MGKPGKKIVLYTRFDFVNMGYDNGFFHSKLALFSGSLWVSVSSFLLSLFRFFIKIFYRYPNLQFDFIVPFFFSFFFIQWLMCFLTFLMQIY